MHQPQRAARCDGLERGPEPEGHIDTAEVLAASYVLSEQAFPTDYEIASDLTDRVDRGEISQHDAWRVVRILGLE